MYFYISMPTKRSIHIEAISTESKIKDAARKVFTQKGFAATRTRDIAEESGLNLALINYYFRSKENLYNEVMIEQLQLFLSSIYDILNDKKTSLHQKFEILVSHYIDMLLLNPNLPLFVLNALNTDPQKFIQLVAKDLDINKLHVAKQWKKLIAVNRTVPSPIHLILNLVSMTVFPFIMAPAIKEKAKMSDGQFKQQMLERKKMIPKWINDMLKNDSTL